MNNLKRSIDNQNNPFNIKETRVLNRVLSSTNFHRHENMKNTIFPSLKNSNSIVVVRKNSLNNSANKKNHYKIEIEKLYDQNVHYKKTIKKLQSEINEIKNELNRKQKILSSVNSEIEQLIKENKEDTEFNMEVGILNDQINEQGRYSLIKKMKNKIKEAERGLNEEIMKNKNLRKDKKFTKFNELEIEKKIINDQNNKIQSLIENSLEMKSNHDKELYQNGIFNNGLESQKNIIYNFMQKFQNLSEEEKRLQNEIAKYEKIINKTNNRVNIVKLKQISLQNQNKKLQKERDDFRIKNKDKESFDNVYLLEELKKKLSEAKSDYNYNRLKHIKNNENLLNIKKNLNENIEQYKRIEKKAPVLEENNKSNDINVNKENSEEYINKLKEIYQENRDKENELEKYLFLYQEAIQKMNTGENINIEDIRNNILRIINKVDMSNKPSPLNMDFVLSENNPYYSNVSENDPLSSGKFTNEQFGQFTYILFKNFEAKKIDYDNAQKNIISPLIEFYQNNKSDSSDINAMLEKLSSKFAEIILKLLNSSNEKDHFMLKLYFNSLYFDQSIGSDEATETSDKIELISHYFLSLFNYIHIYEEKEESDLKKRIKSKYNSQLVKLKNLLREYISKNKEIKENKNYISIKEIKYILDNNNDVKIRGKYIEFIIYCMKQFEDKNASLIDLNVGKLESIVDEPLENEDNINNNEINNPSESNDSGEEVSPTVFNKNIHDVLTLIKQMMTKENKNLREIFVDSIVKITKPEADIITLDSFADEFNKRKIKLNYLQMSCFNYRYCINEELHALELVRIEQDVNNLKEGEIYPYHESNKI